MSFIIKHIPTGLFFSGQGAPNYSINPKKAKVHTLASEAKAIISSLSCIAFYEDTLLHSICRKKELEIVPYKFYTTKNKSCLKVRTNKEEFEIIKYD